MLPFLCNDQRDWEEPGHLKFLNALQEDAGNNFSYLVPMNIVNRKLFPASSWRTFRNFKWPGSSQSLWSLHKNESIHEGWGGDTLPLGRFPPPPPPPTTDYVHRDEIWEIVSSILLKGIEDRNFKRSRSSQSLLSLHKNESIHEGWGGWYTLIWGRLSPPPYHRQILTKFIGTRYEKLFPLHSDLGYSVPPTTELRGTL